MKYQHKLFTIVVVVGLVLAGCIKGVLNGADQGRRELYSIQPIKTTSGMSVVGYLFTFEGRTYIFSTSGGIIEHKSP